MISVAYSVVFIMRQRYVNGCPLSAKSLEQTEYLSLPPRLIPTLMAQQLAIFRGQPTKFDKTSYRPM
jgi:hypothetical protein